MKKLLFLPVFLFGITTYPDFSLCYKIYKHYTIIPINKYYSITAIKPKKYIKYDPDLGIYLIKTKNNKYLHFRKAHLGIWIASITKGSIYAGNYAEYQKSVHIPAKMSTNTKAGSVITDIFCRPIGVGVKGGFLSKGYIQKFIHAKILKKDYLKFMGILFNKDLIVTKVLPNSLASRLYIPVGAKIIKINNKYVYSLDDISQIVHNQKIKNVTLQINGVEFTMKEN